ncbi:MAG: hypothetical protein PHZ02_03365 [Desulfocapsaceae bacterium]|nr:hypothetical protein [Desulfocapsaceae bacterium]
MKNTNVQINKEAQINVGCETSKFALVVGFAMAGLVGGGGFACIISGLVTYGFGGLLKGLITAFTGN